MTTFDDNTERIINEAVERSARAADQTIERAIERLEKRLARSTDEAIERAVRKATDEAHENGVGFYVEATMDEFQAMRESYDMINAKLDNLTGHDRFNELAADVTINRLAVVETNKDIGKLKVRVGKLEHA